MTSLEDFDRQVKGVVTKGKLSATFVDGIVTAAMANVESDSHLVATLWRQHKKAPSANKLTSLYIIDAVAREARSRQKKIDKEGKGKTPAAASPPAAGSTTPLGSPGPSTTPKSKGDGTYASFLKKLEAVLGKLVLDNWENGKEEHKEKVRKVLDIWTKAGTFSSSQLVRISQKLLASSSMKSSSSTPAAGTSGSPKQPSLSPGLSPPPEAKPAPAPAGSGSAIPANVLALLAASSQAAPSAAALEQKKQEEMESEVERVLREARGETSRPSFAGPPPPHHNQSHSYSRPQGPYGHLPPPSSYSRPPPQSGPSSYPPPPQHQPSHAPTPAPAPALNLDPSQLAVLQQIASGGTTPNSQGSHPPPPPQQGSYNGPGQGQYGAPGGHGNRQEDDWGRGAGGPANGHNQGGNYGRPPPPSQPQSYIRPPQGFQPASYPSQGQGQGQSQRAAYERPPPPPSHMGGQGPPRGQTRSFDESNHDGAYDELYGAEEPAAKRPFVPSSQAQAQLSQPPMQAQAQASFSSSTTAPPQPSSTPQQHPVPTPVSAPSHSAQPAPAPSSSAAAPFDPSTFSASSPASWTALANHLRASHPYFSSLPRPPTSEELLTLCAPSAWMALGPPQVRLDELDEKMRGWAEMVGMAVVGTMQGLGMVPGFGGGGAGGAQGGGGMGEQGGQQHGQGGGF
ncbi:hypothetical protein JCM10207_009295 [Rhodosporidiobolus poonsookiae]